jgi:anti-sigma B factor antagonist
MGSDRAQLIRYTSPDARDDVVVVETPLLRVTSRVEPHLHQANVELTGELDLAGVEQVELVLRRAERSRTPVLLIDLSGLHFIDLSGLRLLLAADERARRRGQRMVLLRPAPEAFSIFALTEADQQLTFLD